MKQTKHNRRRETRFPGIVRHAEALGVTRPHLWMVLVGEREDKGKLIPKYKQLLRNERRPIPTDLGKAA